MFALTFIKGIGRRFANIVCMKVDVNMNKRKKDYKNGRYSQVVSNALDMKLREDLESLKKIRKYGHLCCRQCFRDNTKKIGFIKVPSLEHNNQIKGESLDMFKYIDSNFGGLSLILDDPAKREFAEELLSYIDNLSRDVVTYCKGGNVEAGATFDYLKKALSKYDDGPFFPGQFSLLDRKLLKRYFAEHPHENLPDFADKVTEQDMLETFLRPFEMCVKKGDVSSVMSSYKLVNGISTCVDTKLLNDTIRRQ